MGTVMTFSAVMTGVFITNWHLPIPVGILAGLLTGTTVRLGQRHRDLAHENPAVHCHAGHVV